MVQSSKAKIRRLMKKRDKAYEALRFNQDYLHVAADIMDEHYSVIQRRHELKSKKRLLPLELAALPPHDRSKALTIMKLDALTASQKKTRVAIERKFALNLQKLGEDRALAWKNAALKSLELEYDKKAEAFNKNQALKSNVPASKDAITSYQQANIQEEAVMDQLKAKHASEKASRIEALKAKMTQQSQKHQKVFDEANTQLRTLNSANDGMIADNIVLSIQGLKMYFAGIKAVDDLSFDIKKGEIFGLIGPNGAGKTTVFNCVTQFYKPTDGKILYLDRFDNLVSLTDLRTSDVIKTGVSRTFQNLELVYWLSVMDNLLIGAHASYRSTLADQFLHTTKLKREEDVFRQRAAKLLERLGILAYKDMFPFGLPYGVLKKVELARTLMSDPQLIILDEPAAGLNEAETEQLEEIIRLIRDDFNCTIFLVEHDMNLVMNVCDTVCAMSFGKLLAIGTPDEIQGNQLVQEAYLGTE